MKPDPTPFTLYDSDIRTLLKDHPVVELRDRLPPAKSTGCFSALREPELIEALYHLNYPGAYSRLKKLTQPLPPQDAMAACLCALSGTERLLETVLDHCPPVREFQFQGVGKVPSLLAAAAAYDKAAALEILLRRGADPNSGPDGWTSPLEAAFTSQSLRCLEVLLNVPDLEVSLTPPMLAVWGSLRECDHACNPLPQWCCELMAKRLLGTSGDLLGPVPLPPQLRLKYALDCGNGALAARICRERPLGDEDVQDARQFFSAPGRFSLLMKQDSSWELETLQNRLSFLLGFLDARPETLEEPVFRSAVAETALALPEPDPALNRWVERLDCGPVVIRELPCIHSLPNEPVIFPLQSLFESTSLDGEFFPRWDQRLGSRLTPALDRNDAPPFSLFPQTDIRLVLDRVVFTGAASPGHLSPAAGAVLAYAPEDQLPRLLQPGALLAEEPASLLLDACQKLEPGRRNAILPHIRKEAHYAL